MGVSIKSGQMYNRNTHRRTLLPQNLFLLFFLFLSFPQTLLAHIQEGQGSALQLYSNRITGLKPVIDGSILSRNGDPSSKDSPAEWKEAYTRQITLSDGNIATLFLMNDDDTLYVAAIYEHNNNGDGTGVRLYFDEGPGGGPHDNLLTSGATRNEAGFAIIRNGGTAELSDVSWNGSAWASDGDGQKDFRGARHFFNDAIKVHMQEFAIPLKNPKPKDANNSDLKISLEDELGFYIQVEKRGAGAGTFHWTETNGNVNDAGTGVGWADLRLNIKQSFSTFYATLNANGNPTINGDLSDDAWRGSYRRNIVLTNFKGAAIPAVFRAVQDHGTGIVYVGLEIQHADADAVDYAQVYLEADATNAVTNARNYLLESGHEDATRATGAAMTDMYWNGTAWTADTEGADTHAAFGTHASGRYQYEFAIPYRDAVAGQDINVPDKAAPGLFIRFHDNSRPAGERDFYWEYSANVDAINVDPNTTTRLAGGWSLFQFGAPYTQVVFPADGSKVEGVVHVRIVARDIVPNGIDSTYFYLNSNPGTTYPLIRIADQDEYAGQIDVSALADGPDSLVIHVVNNDGIALDRLVYIDIDNIGGAVEVPVVALTSPTAGSQVSGNIAVTFGVTSSTATTRAVSIDGGAYSDLSPTSASTFNWNTASLADGSHTLQFRAINTDGISGTSHVITFIVNNSPTVTLNAPAGGSTLSGNSTITYATVAVAPASVASESLFVDGKVHSLLSPSGTDTFNSTSLVDGEHSLQIKATDSNGKVGWSQLVHVLVRNAPSIVLDSALADMTASGRLAIRFATQVVAPATVQKTEIALNGGAFRATSTDSSDTLDTRALSDGSHLIQVRVTDSEGKTGLSQIIKFNLKNSPTVRIENPSVDAVVRGVVRVDFTAEAVAPDSIVSTQISVGGGDWIPTSSASHHELDTRNFQDGDLLLAFKTIDASGKEDTSMIREILVDNSPPAVSSLHIAYAEGAAGKMGDKIVISAQALDFIAGMDPDSGLVLFSTGGLTQAVTILHDDGENGDVVQGDNVFSAELTIDTDTSGSLTFSLRGRDAVGNDTLLQSALVLDNRAPEISITVEPAPETIGVDGKTRVYVPRISIKGSFWDEGGSGVAAAILSTVNDSGLHINNSPLAIPVSSGNFSRVLHLVPGVNTIRLQVWDHAGNQGVATEIIEYVVPKVTQVVTSKGGRVENRNGSAVNIPVNALYQSAEISIWPTSPLEQPKPLDAKIRLLGVPHEFGPDGTVFRQPVTLTLTYTEADLDTNQNGRADFNPDKFSIVFWNGNTWVSAGDARVDKEKRTVSVNVNHFTLFDIAQDDNAPPAKLVTYWNRNPIVGRSEFIYKVPKPGKVSLQILDMAGDMVHNLIHPNTPVQNLGSVQWDGANVSGRFAGAGLYIYVFRYESDDGGTREIIRKPIGLTRN